MTEVKVIKPFYLEGKVVEAGAVVGMNAADAAYVVTIGRAELVDVPEAPAAKPKKSAK